MAPHANWKGYLKLSLVSCAVALYPATSSSSRVSFNTLNRDTGNRIKRRYTDAITGEVVEPDETVKGYQVGKGVFLQVEEEEIDSIRIESTHTIDIERFVPRDEVDERYLDTPYYLAPEDKVAQEAFSVIRDAMHEKGRAGLGRVVMSRREHMVLLEPLGKGILATLLRYPYEVRGEEPYFEDIPDIVIPAELRILAGHIIETKTATFDPGRFEDRYETALIAMLKEKQGSRAPKTQPDAPRPSNVVNLMDALRRSIDAEKTGDAPKAGVRKPQSTKTSAPTTQSKGAKKASSGRAAVRKAG